MIRPAVLALLATAGVARAGAPPASAPPAGPPPPPDGAVEDAGDANLEPDERRHGVTFAITTGGGLIVGFGIDDSVGRGGALALRLGHVATRRTVITFELAATAALHRPATTGGTATNTNVKLAAGAQYYVVPSAYLRLAGGLGVYQGREVELPNGQRGSLDLAGLAVVGGFGVDLVRYKWAVVGFELTTSATITGEGTLLSTSFGLGVTLD
jgi:hypothetical protein